MKIVIMGSGGVGGYFGARLADAGEDVSFVARGRHLEAIKSKGLKIKSELGNTTIDPAAAKMPISVPNWRATSVATVPLQPSSSNVIVAKLLLPVLKPLVAPIFPAPTDLMSPRPENLTRRRPNGIDPSR